MARRPGSLRSLPSDVPTHSYHCTHGPQRRPEDEDEETPTPLLGEGDRLLMVDMSPAIQVR
jgi:hypothetical protein